ncbi:MAG: UDP-N-acetylmuramyl-tripeptide synthetase [Candidatus Zambryskibacteria bacterium]|nr:UDP-N-acetylmuramyl-tripeptide synthetase [Candidatus Zambryskibacteria bacterium]
MEENKFLAKILNLGRKIIPKRIFKFFQPFYHCVLAILGAALYSFPGKKLVVIGVTGTKGKTTTTELVNSILEEAGFKTALQNTIHFKIGDQEKRNLFKMSMPGRFFMQKFLRKAVKTGCTHAVIEITSEGVKLFRHKFLYLDALIFTNLSPEHIESHSSYEKYIKAKLDIARELEGQKNRTIVANIDDNEGQTFLDLNIPNKVPYSLHKVTGVSADENGSSFQIDKIVIHSKLPGIFNVYNMLGALSYAKFVGIADEKIKAGLEKINFIRGRMEKIKAGQDFDVVVDYAHTPDSLEAAYEAYKNHKKICVLGNTGGGRDKWKRKEMGKIADEYCDQIILTNEDPYDENPKKIIEDMLQGIKEEQKVEIIMDRRTAIHEAIKKACILRQAQGSSTDKIAVIITGKGTDPYIMGPHGTKQKWDDATVAKEELHRIIV